MITASPNRFGAGRRTQVLAAILALALCLPALAPLFVIGFASIAPDPEIWAHLSRFVLPDVVTSTSVFVTTSGNTFVAVGFLDFSGPLQTWLRRAFGSSAWFPPIRSLGGAAVVLSLALYPYVYLLARSAFLTQGRKALEAAQSLGYGRAAAGWKVALPMARPWIFAGIALTDGNARRLRRCLHFQCKDIHHGDL
jgi:iron(III) transport system permease protein